MGFSEKTLSNIGHHLWEVEFALEGLGALFRSVNEDGCLGQDELYGINKIIILIKNEMRKARRAAVDQNIKLELKEFISQDDLEKIKGTGQGKEEGGPKKEASLAKSVGLRRLG